MDKIVINKLKNSVNVDVQQLASILYTCTLQSSSIAFARFESTSGTASETFAKSHDGRCLVNSHNNPASLITDFGANNGYIYIRGNNLQSYPATVAIEVYPKYNLKAVTVNHLSDLEPCMTMLENVIATYDGIVPDGNDNLSHYSPDGDIAILNKIPSIKVFEVYATPLNMEALTGDVGKIGNMVNLIKFKTYNCQVYGDLAETLDTMVANGRDSGELEFRSWSSKVVLSYQGEQIRIGASTVTHQSGNVYGWKIGFDTNGWSVLETYTTMS